MQRVKQFLFTLLVSGLVSVQSASAQQGIITAEFDFPNIIGKHIVYAQIELVAFPFQYFWTLHEVLPNGQCSFLGIGSRFPGTPQGYSSCGGLSFVDNATTAVNSSTYWLRFYECTSNNQVYLDLGTYTPIQQTFQGTSRAFPGGGLRSTCVTMP